MNEALDNDFIWVMVEPEATVEPEGDSSGARTPKGGGNVFNEPVRLLTPPPTGAVSNLRPVKVRASDLEQGMGQFLTILGRVFRQAQQSAGELAGMELDEIELAVASNGEGQVSLMGTGGKVGGSTGMTLKFKRSSKSQ